MKYFIFIILCCFPWEQTFGQQDSATIKVDSITYSIYLAEDWNKLIETGNEAIDKNIDFFYLRMRIAWAYFMKENYRMAIPHYKKALQHKPGDPVALTYLCYSYEYGGRKADAVALSAEISTSVSEPLHQRYKNPLLAAGIFYTYNQSNASTTQKKLGNGNIPDDDGMQKTTNNYQISNLFLTHRIGRKLSFSHSLSYLKKSEHNFFVADGVLYTYPNLNLFQLNYDLKANFNIKEKVILSPFLNYTYFKIPLEDYDLEDYEESYTNYGLSVHTNFPYWYVGASFSSGTINAQKQNQFGLHITYFPKGNLNLYYNMNVYYQNQETDGQHFIHRHVLGFKTTKIWWMELYAIPCTYQNFYDVATGSMWNGLNKAKNQVGISNIFLLYKYHLSLFLNTSAYNSVSQFVPSENGNRTNTYNYNNMNISGGVLWKL